MSDLGPTSCKGQTGIVPFPRQPAGAEVAPLHGPETFLRIPPPACRGRGSTSAWPRNLSTHPPASLQGPSRGSTSAWPRNLSTNQTLGAPKAKQRYAFRFCQPALEPGDRRGRSGPRGLMVQATARAGGVQRARENLLRGGASRMVCPPGVTTHDRHRPQITRMHRSSVLGRTGCQ